MEEEIEEQSTEDQYSDYNLDFGEENKYVMTLNTDFDYYQFKRFNKNI